MRGTSERLSLRDRSDRPAVSGGARDSRVSVLLPARGEKVAEGRMRGTSERLATTGVTGRRLVASRARPAGLRVADVAGDHERVTLTRTEAEARSRDGDGVNAGKRLRDDDAFNIIQAIGLTGMQ